MNRDFSVGFSISLFVLFALFVFRLIYGYVVVGGDQERQILNTNEISQSRDSIYQKQNIASKRLKSEAIGSPSRQVDQKYEKVATIETQSTDLDSDEKKIRELINTSGSIIQNERSYGLKSKHDRTIKLAIGVPPESFDEMVENFKSFGKIILLTIDKKDKTNEYKDLQAKKESLLKIRSSLASLKNKGGRIDEYISLENRILEIEDEIQKLGISLGEYDSENEFCTVLLTLYESKHSGEISIIHRIKVALEWAIKYFCLLGFSFLMLIPVIYFGASLIRKMKIQFFKGQT
jgi:hypothetical protein